MQQSTSKLQAGFRVIRAWRGWLVAHAALSAVLAAHLPANANPRELPPGTLRVQQLEIIDRQGFERPMLAVTMLLPAGWQQEGAIVWQPGQRCGAPLHTRIAARSPDGVSAIELAATEG